MVVRGRGAARLVLPHLPPAGPSAAGAGARGADVTERLVLRERRAAGVAGRLLDLAERVGRLPPPGHRDPERFWLDRSELAGELRRLAKEALAE